MNTGELDAFVRKIVRPATLTRIPKPTMRTIFNLAKNDLAAFMRLYKKHEDFDIEENTQNYYLSDIASDYLIVDDSGVHYQNSSSKWDDLDPYTRKKLDVDYPDWRNNSSSAPERYYIETNMLVFDPTPNLDTTGRIYYAAKPPDTTDDAHYLFCKLNDQSVEIPQFSLLDECVIAYADWYLTNILVENEPDKIIKKWNTYVTLREDKKNLLYGRPDVFSNEDNLMRGPIVC